MYSIEAIHGYSDSVLREILTVSRNSLPESWQYPDEEDYYGQQLHNEKAIHLLLRRDNLPIGYLLAIPHNEAARDEDLRCADPALVEDPDRIYVETLEIVTEYAKSLVSGKLSLMMFRALIEEADKRGRCKFSMHVRMTSGLNRVLRKLFGDILTNFRIIDNWPFYNGEEPTEYTEGTYQAKFVVSKWL